MTCNDLGQGIFKGAPFETTVLDMEFLDQLKAY
jgi:hypothetical protein